MPRLQTPEGVRIDVPFESLSAVIAKLPAAKKIRLPKALMAEPAVEEFVLELNPRIRKDSSCSGRTGRGLSNRSTTASREVRAYRVEVTKGAQKPIGALSPKDFRRIDRVILSLEGNPRPPGCKKLQAEQNVYRLRHGNYRIIYHVNDGVYR